MTVRARGDHFFMYSDEGYFGKFVWIIGGVIRDLVLPFWVHGPFLIDEITILSSFGHLMGKSFLIF